MAAPVPTWDAALLRWAAAHAWSDADRSWVADAGAESLEDLAEYFAGGEELPEVPGLAAALAAVKAYCRSREGGRAHEIFAHLAKMERARQPAAKRAPPAAAKAFRPGGGLRWRPRLAVRRAMQEPQETIVVDEPVRDDSARRAAAEEATALAASWLHAGSFGHRLEAAPAREKDALMEEKVQQLMAFEPRTIRHALRTWAALCAHAGSASSSASPSSAAASTFILKAKARGATVPRKAWEAMAWVVKHLNAPPRRAAEGQAAAAHRRQGAGRGRRR